MDLTQEELLILNAATSDPNSLIFKMTFGKWSSKICGPTSNEMDVPKLAQLESAEQTSQYIKTNANPSIDYPQFNRETLTKNY